MAEYRAIRNALPGDNVRINSTKSMIGHLLGAAGAVEAVAVIQAMQTGQHFSCPFLSLLHLFCSSLLVLRFVFSVFPSARLLFSSPLSLLTLSLMELKEKVLLVMLVHLARHAVTVPLNSTLRLQWHVLNDHPMAQNLL